MIDSINFNKELTQKEFFSTVNSEFIEWNSYVETEKYIMYGSFFSRIKSEIN